MVYYVFRNGEKIWKADDFSYEDINQINKMYSCSGYYNILQNIFWFWFWFNIKFLASYLKKAKQEFNLVKCKDKMTKGLVDI